MNLLKDADRVRRRYDELWNLENHDRPILTIQTPKRNAPPGSGTSAGGRGPLAGL